MAEAKWVKAAKDCLLWPPVPFREVDPYKELGVARSRLAQEYAERAELLPPYVERDIDERALKRLRSHGSVLLIGTRASGVTRSAYELALAVSASSVAIVPQGPHGLATALGALDVLSRPECGTRQLLWLDKVDTLARGGLTATMLRRCRERPGLRIVATISSTEYKVWSAENPVLAAEFGDPILLKRVPSAQEVKRAAAAYPGVDFSEGIAAAFTVVAELLKQLNSGDNSCPYEPAGDDCALAREVVDVAVVWASTDIGRPLPVGRLFDLVQQRLGEHRRIDGKHLKRALKWAGSPAVGSASLLVRETDSEGKQVVIAQADVAEIHRAEAEEADEAVWTAALDAAGHVDDSEALGRIGFRAHVDGNVGIAAQAWAMVTAVDDPAVVSLRRSFAFSRERDDPAAEVPPLERLLGRVSQ
ncbi:hypothetical protein [Rhodococcus koreensis]|uniref:hypothetical protein n=1 Tax=Rhodococcus koreensis TaxID=99653 RepID=UPI0036722B64